MSFKPYQCHKKVQAFRIHAVEYSLQPDHDNAVRIYPEGGGEPIVKGMEWAAIHKPGQGGYFVRYEDGYESFSPAEPFESGYTPIEEAP